MVAPHSAGDGRRHVLAVTPGAELYGSDRMFLESIEGMAARGWDVTVLAASAGPLLDAARAVGAAAEIAPVPVLRRVHATPSGMTRFAVDCLRAMPGLLHRLRRHRPDVVYLNTVAMPAWCLATAILRVPSVLHVHEAESQTRRLVQIALSAPTLLVDRIIYNSHTSRSVARHALGPLLRRSTVIPNAVGFAGPIEPGRERIDGSVRLVYVGRLSARKGVDVAIDAVATLRTRGVPATLDIVGEVFAGNEGFRDGLQARAAAADLQGSVTFHGFQATPDTFVRGADILLVPSRSPESFGNVLIEAVGQGRPAIAAAQSGLVEASRGLSSVTLVPAGDAVAVADAVCALLPQWPQVTARARDDAATVRARHDPEVYRSSVIAAVADAISRGRADADTDTVGAGVEHEERAGLSLRHVAGEAPVLVVSPHLDDAVLSAFGLLELGRPVDVLNVFDGAPQPPARTGWDRLCGFPDSDAALQARHAENDAAFAGSAHRSDSLGLLDAQYLDGPRHPDDARRLAEQVRSWIARHDGPVVVAVPAGAGRIPRATATGQPQAGRRSRRARIRRLAGPLGRRLLNLRASAVARRTAPVQHEDHTWVRDVVLPELPSNATALLYEELPYRWGARGDEAVGRLALPHRPEVFDELVDRRAKAARVAAYRSQLLFMHAPNGDPGAPAGLPSHERYWRVSAQSEVRSMRRVSSAAPQGSTGRKLR